MGGLLARCALGQGVRGGSKSSSGSPSRRRKQGRAALGSELLRMHPLWLTFRSSALEARYARWHSAHHCWVRPVQRLFPSASLFCMH